MVGNNYTPLNHLVQQTKSKNEPVSLHKESEPLPSPEAYLKEVVEHQPQEEVREYVRLKAESIELPPDLKKIGAQSSQSTSFPTYQNIKLPLADDRIIPGLHASITSSFRWLATLAMYILRHAHLALKVVGGKTVRVFKK